jgi:hypothetical protein
MKARKKVDRQWGARWDYWVSHGNGGSWGFAVFVIFLVLLGLHNNGVF